MWSWRRAQSRARGLLLIADRQCDDKIFAPDGILGRFLNDHLSAPIADLAPHNRAALNRVVGFRFERGAMRNLRFEMRGAARRQSKTAGELHAHRL